MNGIKAVSALVPRTTDDPEQMVALFQMHPDSLSLLVHVSGAETIPVDITGGDPIPVAPDTSRIFNGTTSLTPKFAVIDHAGNGDNTLVAAVTSKKIRVLAVMMIAGGSVNARFESGAGGTALSGQMQLTAQSGFTLPFNPVGWFETAAGSLLNLELSAAVSVDGMLVYVEV